MTRGLPWRFPHASVFSFSQYSSWLIADYAVGGIADSGTIYTILGVLGPFRQPHGQQRGSESKTMGDVGFIAHQSEIVSFRGLNDVVESARADCGNGGDRVYYISPRVLDRVFVYPIHSVAESEDATSSVGVSVVSDPI